jgi:poly(A)-specific ribonuclease
LVHQLVRAEYGDKLTTYGRRESVIVKEIDRRREARIQKERKQRVKKEIYRQTGFRWVIEAMTGGSLHGIDIAWFAKDPEDGSDIFFDEHDFTNRFNRYAANLKMKRPVLVGHNLFTDLVYLYQSFIGPLPDSVSEFRIRIHDLFPTIVDTKYLATHNCGNINPSSSLEQTEEAVRNQQIPKIETHSEHTKYVNQAAFHEAGYDSLLTARVMILLSANLEAAGTYWKDAPLDSPVSLSPDEEDYYTAPDNFDGQSLSEGPDGNGPTPTADIPISRKSSGKGKKKSKSKDHGPKEKSRFATKTSFDALRDDLSPPTADDLLNMTHQQLRPTPAGPSHRKASSLNPKAAAFGALPISKSTVPFVPQQQSTTSKVQEWQETQEKQTQQETQATATNAQGKQPEEREAREVERLMPPFNSDFWRVYANKLRIFGTKETMLDLDPLRIR